MCIYHDAETFVCHTFSYNNLGGNLSEEEIIQIVNLRYPLKDEKTKEYIKRSMSIYGVDSYNYDCVHYVKKKKKVKLYCNKHGGYFEQSPDHHFKLPITRHRCPICSGTYNFSTEEIIRNAKKVHGARYDYSLTNYKNANTKVQIICRDHGVFEQTSSDHISKGYGCPSCRSLVYGAKTAEDKRKAFIELSIKKHGNKFDYSDCVFIDSQTKIQIFCNSHRGYFAQVPSRHLSDSKGCPVCSKACKNITTEMFIDNAKKQWGDRYDYSLVEYKKAIEKVEIICRKHGVFLQSPNKHLMQQEGCQKCAKACFISKPETEWLDLIGIPSHQRNVNLPSNVNTTGRCNVDAFDPETNTVYMFHGDFWHGNPNIFNHDDINKVTKKSFGELYERTIAIEDDLKQQGYQIVALWEKDWPTFKQIWMEESLNHGI